MSRNDILSIGGAQDDTASIVLEVRVRVKMVAKCK